MSWVLAPVLWIFTFELWFTVLTVFHILSVAFNVTEMVFFWRIADLPVEDQIKAYWELFHSQTRNVEFIPDYIYDNETQRLQRIRQQTFFLLVQMMPFQIMTMIVVVRNLKSILSCFERHFVIQSFNYMFVMFFSTLLWKIMMNVTFWA